MDNRRSNNPLQVTIIALRMRMDTMSGYFSPRGVFQRKKVRPLMSSNKRLLRGNLPQKPVRVVVVVPLLVGKADPKGPKAKARVLGKTPRA